MAKNDVFISYRSTDLERVEELARALHEHYINVWLDRWDLVPGEPWQAGLENAISSARSAIVFVGLVALTLSGALIWCATLYHNQGSLSFGCGLHATTPA